MGAAAPHSPIWGRPCWTSWNGPDAFCGCSSTGCLTILSVILIYLILGDDSGVFVKSVTDNVMKFAGGVPTPSLIGIGVILAIVVLVMQRVR